MSVFLVPDLNPIGGGTYFPPEDRWGRPGFKSVLLAFAKKVRIIDILIGNTIQFVSYQRATANIAYHTELIFIRLTYRMANVL